MFGYKSKIEASDLKVEVQDLKKEIAQLNDSIRIYQARLVNEYSKASYSLDWKTMNAFSIERMWENGTHKTVVGYLMQEPVTVTEDNVTTKDVIREWTLYCSHEEHERLVQEFNEYKKAKYI